MNATSDYAGYLYTVSLQVIFILGRLKVPFCGIFYFADVEPRDSTYSFYIFLL